MTQLQFAGARRALLLFNSAAIALLASACGGGGGSGSSPAPVPAPSPAPAPAPSPAPGAGVVTSVPPSTYPSASIEAAIYARLNTERAQCGFGLLAQSAKLDQSAQAHASYLLNQQNTMAPGNAYISHSETVGQPGYTGATPSDRGVAAGYGPEIGESIDTSYSQPGASNSFRGDEIAFNAFDTAYHMALLISGQREVGLGVVTSTNTGNAYQFDTMVADVGYGAAGVPQVPTSVSTYPCSGTLGVRPIFQAGTESPDPAPSLGLSYPLGTPIFVQAPGALAGVGATVVSAGGQAVSAGILTSANDQNHELTADQAVIIPSAPLAASTSYTVTVTGTAGGTPFTKTLTFTTGVMPS